MGDERLIASKLVVKTAQDHWEDTEKYLSELEETTLKDGLPAAETDTEPRYYVHMTQDTDDGFSVYVDTDNKYITVEATLGPWQAKQVIDFIRNLPKEPDNE